MIAPRLFLCSGAVRDSAGDRHVLELDAVGHRPTVNIRLQNVARKLLRTLSPRQIDLVEIASYVYAADAATPRGTAWSNNGGTESWARDFRFVIPVRDHGFWGRSDVVDLLRETLGFLADDTYSFEFEELPKQQDRPAEQYLELDQDDWPFYGVERVVMFSGGLDSLAGVCEAAKRGERLALVSHRPAANISSRQTKLFKGLQATYPTAKMLHVPVWVNKDAALGHEHTQRTRSFLFSAIGFVVAQSLGAKGIRFYENGVVSLNLPIAEEVLRSRASRTTHPITLSLLSRLLTTVADQDFNVENPYEFLTKAEVVSRICDSGARGLIEHTCSCAHTMFQPRSQHHCGCCSQCIDRRVAVIAAGASDADPDTDYSSDVFTGPRTPGYDQNVAVDYVRLASELNQLDEEQLWTRFNMELSRAIRPYPRRSDAAKSFIDMVRRHVSAVMSVIEGQYKANVTTQIRGRLEPTSLIALVAGQKHLEPAWRRYCERIAGILSASIPEMCRTHKPCDERHLQELCDGALKGQFPDLVREFPFMRWGSVMTKPDWSGPEESQVWVELKYVRKKEDVSRITRDIAEDITKYGDNQRRVLFVVYDPEHHLDDTHFAEPIRRRPEMTVQFVR